MGKIVQFVMERVPSAVRLILECVSYNMTLIYLTLTLGLYSIMHSLPLGYYVFHLNSI